MTKPFFIHFYWNRYFFKELRCRLFFHRTLAQWIQYFGFQSGTCKHCGMCVQARRTKAYPL